MAYKIKSTKRMISHLLHESALKPKGSTISEFVDIHEISGLTAAEIDAKIVVHDATQPNKFLDPTAAVINSSYVDTEGAGWDGQIASLRKDRDPANAPLLKAAHGATGSIASTLTTDPETGQPIPPENQVPGSGPDITAPIDENGAYTQGEGTTGNVTYFSVQVPDGEGGYDYAQASLTSSGLPQVTTPLLPGEIMTANGGMYVSANNSQGPAHGRFSLILDQYSNLSSQVIDLGRDQNGTPLSDVLDNLSSSVVLRVSLVCPAKVAQESGLTDFQGKSMDKQGRSEDHVDYDDQDVEGPLAFWKVENLSELSTDANGSLVFSEDDETVWVVDVNQMQDEAYHGQTIRKIGNFFGDKADPFFKRSDHEASLSEHAEESEAFRKQRAAWKVHYEQVGAEEIVLEFFKGMSAVDQAALLEEFTEQQLENLIMMQLVTNGVIDPYSGLLIGAMEDIQQAGADAFANCDTQACLDQATCIAEGSVAFQNSIMTAVDPANPTFEELEAANAAEQQALEDTATQLGYMGGYGEVVGQADQDREQARMDAESAAWEQAQIDVDDAIETALDNPDQATIDQAEAYAQSQLQNAIYSAGVGPEERNHRFQNQLQGGDLVVRLPACDGVLDPATGQPVEAFQLNGESITIKANNVYSGSDENDPFGSGSGRLVVKTSLLDNYSRTIDGGSEFTLDLTNATATFSFDGTQWQVK